jgi:hypothetical protein
MKNHNLNRLIVLLLIVGVSLSLELVIKGTHLSNTCPMIGVIPACYLALTYFVLLLLIQLRNKNELLFFVFSGFALALSLFASLGKIVGSIECPGTFLKIPLCFLVFMVFALIVALKFLVVKKNKKL